MNLNLNLSLTLRFVVKMEMIDIDRFVTRKHTQEQLFGGLAALQGFKGGVDLGVEIDLKEGPDDGELVEGVVGRQQRVRGTRRPNGLALDGVRLGGVERVAEIHTKVLELLGHHLLLYDLVLRPQRVRDSDARRGREERGVAGDGVPGAQGLLYVSL